MEKIRMASVFIIFKEWKKLKSLKIAYDEGENEQ